MEERVQKILARAGYGSRRSCEELIIARRVRVNGVTITLGSRADAERDTITVDQQSIGKKQPEFVYIALHKPRGVLSDVDPKYDDRRTVRDLVPVEGHLFAVGRLDYDSEGLILLTNDGELANRLTHPRYGHEKEYRVLVATHPDQQQLETWRRGVVMEDGTRTLPAEVRVEGEFGKGSWMRVILREGRKRQIREVGSLIGLPVVRIIRVRIGGLMLGYLRPNEWRYLSAEEVQGLRDLQNQPAAPRPGRRPMLRRGPGGGGFPAPRKAPARPRAGESRFGKSERSEGDAYPSRRKPFGDRPAGDERAPQRRSGGPRSSEGDTGYAPRRPFGDRPAGDERAPQRRSGGPRSSEGDRGSAPRRPFGDRPAGDERAPQRRSGGPRSGEGGDAGSAPRRPFGDRPAGDERAPQRRSGGGGPRPGGSGAPRKPGGRSGFGGGRPSSSSSRRPSGSRPAGRGSSKPRRG